MACSRSHGFTVTIRVVVTLPEDCETSGPLLTEKNLSDPDESADAAMDYRLPRDANPEILCQAQRTLIFYIGWLLDEAPARYPSWAKDELQRGVRRLVEVETAAKTARPGLH